IVAVGAHQVQIMCILITNGECVSQLQGDEGPSATEERSSRGEEGFTRSGIRDRVQELERLTVLVDVVVLREVISEILLIGETYCGEAVLVRGPLSISTHKCGGTEFNFPVQTGKFQGFFSRCKALDNCSELVPTGDTFAREHLRLAVYNFQFM